MTKLPCTLVVAGLLLAIPQASPVHAATAAEPNPIQVENAQAGTSSTQWLPPHFPPTRIQGYASETSVLPGESVRLHVATAAGDRYRIELYRLGWYGGAGARLIA